MNGSVITRESDRYALVLPIRVALDPMAMSGKCEHGFDLPTLADCPQCLHVGTVEVADVFGEGDGYRSYCSCGWHGPARYDDGECWKDYRAHADGIYIPTTGRVAE